MRERRRATTVAGVGMLAVLLVGCMGGSPQPTSSPEPPSPTPITEELRAEQSLVESTWTGIDSAGDTTSFTFEADHTVTVNYNGRQWDDASDTWSLSDGVLTVTVHIDETHGDIVYRAPYDEGAASLAFDGTASMSGRTLNVTLERR
ncbi:hypothetical protein OH146_13395 [Salinibacterium sp. SYSU T00001]|uniref:hypothetical protein n=1 Tax=Homoserinimonas sedimenticola TaxID=2986805 RepID=UPI002236733F|nr:hypothetical protein [Salinibacterium sedimenticola]MCW4386769.1 hypothetical protein [Salinibacterium sedimenticola]